MLMKGRTHIQLGEINKAIDAFFTLMIEYPEIKEAPETNYLVGYCYMLQGEFEEAREAYGLLVRDYPESNYSNQAKMYLNRINNMTD
jgi:TolA-binding protein